MGVLERAGSRSIEKFTKNIFQATMEENILANHYWGQISNIINEKNRPLSVKIVPDGNDTRSGDLIIGKVRDNGDFAIEITKTETDTKWLLRHEMKHMKILGNNKFCFKQHNVNNYIRQRIPVLYIHHPFSNPTAEVEDLEINSNSKARWFSIDELKGIAERTSYPLAEFGYDHKGWRLFFDSYDDWFDFYNMPDDLSLNRLQEICKSYAKQLI